MKKNFMTLSPLPTEKKEKKKVNVDHTFCTMKMNSHKFQVYRGEV